MGQTQLKYHSLGKKVLYTPPLCLLDWPNGLSLDEVSECYNTTRGNIIIGISEFGRPGEFLNYNTLGSYFKETTDIKKWDKRNMFLDWEENMGNECSKCSQY